ncbi:MAG: helix-turn-helix domain-containing protein [Actinomycetota bacterium]|nr:helix-turn-helix domain-containing protein [Actinomycetota bacterium]
MNSTFAQTAGRVLRGARVRHGLTLQEVERRSQGRFKPSALGGYERAERKISLEIFCDLAAVYGEAPEQLLAEVTAELEPQARSKVVIDLDKLTMLEDGEARMVGELVHKIKAQRGDYVSGVISLRGGDVQAMSSSAGMKPELLLRRLRPAMKSD